MKIYIDLQKGEKIEVLGQMVLVKVAEPVEKHGHIYIPDTAKQQSQRGTVIAVGRGRQLENGEFEKIYVKEGDEIIFTQYYGFDEIYIGNERHLLVRHQDIMAKIKTGGKDAKMG